jgi:hypothetical protein
VPRPPTVEQVLESVSRLPFEMSHFYQVVTEDCEKILCETYIHVQTVGCPDKRHIFFIRATNKTYTVSSNSCAVAILHMFMDATGQKVVFYRYLHAHDVKVTRFWTKKMHNTTHQQQSTICI